MPIDFFFLLGICHCYLSEILIPKDNGYCHHFHFADTHIDDH